MQSREKREFWTEEESKNETRQLQSKKEKTFLERGKEQNETSSGARRRLFQQQKHTYFIELERDQDRRDSLEEIQPKPELRRSFLKEGDPHRQLISMNARECERWRTLPTLKHIGRKLLNMDGDMAESTVDSGNRCETHWVEYSERAAQNARLPRSSELAITLEDTVPRKPWIVEFASRILRTLGELKEPWTPWFDYFQPSFTTSFHDYVPFSL